MQPASGMGHHHQEESDGGQAEEGDDLVIIVSHYALYNIWRAELMKVTAVTESSCELNFLYPEYIMFKMFV